jgi:hypothetical protein
VQCYRIILSLLLPVACLGTSVVRISLEDTVAQAQWIVEGDVVRNSSAWDSGHRFIWTNTEIAVRQTWKGSVGPIVTVSEPGGVVNGMSLDVAGMVRYTPGEHVVVFLYRTPIGLIRTVGLGQGKLQVDSRGMVHPSFSDAMLVSVAGARPSGTSIRELEATSLTAARKRIAGIAAALKAARK